nr:MAG TPA: hypothetical protein [Caudoviricetes sp.]
MGKVLPITSGEAAHVLSMVSIRGRVGSWGFGTVDLKDHA